MTLQLASPENFGIKMLTLVGVDERTLRGVVEEQTNQAEIDEAEDNPFPITLNSAPSFEPLAVGAESIVNAVVDMNCG